MSPLTTATPRPRDDAGYWTGRRPAALAALTALLCAVLLAACGGSSSPPPSSASPTPEPSPPITGGAPPAAAVAVVREFWKLVADGRLPEAQRFLVAPGAPIQQWDGADIGDARFVRLVPDSTATRPPEGSTIQFAVVVWIEPASAVSPWGGAGTHRLFESVVRMSDGSWRMYESGTGP